MYRAGVEEIAAFNRLLRMFNATGNSNATDLVDLTMITDLVAQAGQVGEEAAQGIVENVDSVVSGILGGSYANPLPMRIQRLNSI